ncbi:hypothetical protein EUX98_g7476 [Antrodiella citrinella]|uniref:glutathione transferase n=1 Tax=Antrodiella citrinella TaxID=2447956 RepID=A0A4S4MLQ6_9APHY|nr:hypothetical protein EUX98_g7476 [Antrodiella citrinella]
MAIQIFGFPLSIATRRSLVVLKELKVPYELVIVDFMKGEHRLPENVKYQPFGEIPYLKDLDNSLILYESRAIGRYLVNKYDPDNKTGLLPRDGIAAAKFEQAASVEFAKFDPSAMGLTRELVLKPVFEKQEGDQAEIAKHLAGLNRILDVYEDILAKQKYLAGDHVTLVDLWHLSLGTMLTDFARSDVLTTEKRPNVQRWWKDISSRPTWVEVAVKSEKSPVA